MSLVTSILASCLSINLVRSGAGVIQNSAGTRVLKPYSRGVIDSTRPKNGRVRLHHLGQSGDAHSSAWRVAPDTALYLGINVYQHPHTFPAVRPGYASLEKLPDHLTSFQTFSFTLPAAIVLTFVGLTRSLLSVDYIQAHASSWMMLKRAKRMKRNLRYCKSIQSGTLNTLHRLRC